MNPSTITAARGVAETTLTETATVSAATGPATFDPVSGTVTAAARAVIWSGPASLHATSGPMQRTEGGAAALHEEWVLAVPVSAPPFPPGVSVAVTRTGAAAGVDLPGEVWVSRVATTGTVNVLRRYIATTVRPGSDAA